MSDWRDQNLRDLARGMKHEFGHALGLDHDGRADSVMYGKVGGAAYSVTPADRAFLREVYRDDT
jgi:predicted Zn-dependent protease